MSNFESFLEDSTPRSIPTPSPFIQNNIKATVPEVSLILDKPETINPINQTHNNYVQQDSTAHMFNINRNVSTPICVANYQNPQIQIIPYKENIPSIANGRRKQVRFENQTFVPSSSFKQSVIGSQLPNEMLQSTSDSTVGDRKLNLQTVKSQPKTSYQKDAILYSCQDNISHMPSICLSSAKNYTTNEDVIRLNTNCKTINPPISSDLDLSLFDAAISVNKGTQIGKHVVHQTSVPSYNQFKALYHASVPDNNVASSSQYIPCMAANSMSKCSVSIKETDAFYKDHEYETATNRTNVEATVSELYKIVKLQNEQLQCLQEQVQNLLFSQQKAFANVISEPPFAKVISEPLFANLISEPPSVNLEIPQAISESTVIDSARSTEPNVQKISIGVMTSFQVSFDNLRSQKITDESTLNSNKINGVSEPLGNEKKDEILKEIEQTNDTVTIDDIIIDNLTQDSPSPENSIHLEMKEYSESEGECSGSHVGWTFYNNVLGQVNDILQKSPQYKASDRSEYKMVAPSTTLPGRSFILPDNVKFKTIDQLKQLGVSFADVNISAAKRVTFDSVYDHKVMTTRQKPASKHLSDQSLAINAMALKYIRGEELGTIVAKNQLPFSSLSTIKSAMVHPNIDNDLSLATIKYMDKYHILNAKHIQKSPLPADSPKFLDITALKQQAKLF